MENIEGYTNMHYNNIFKSVYKDKIFADKTFVLKVRKGQSHRGFLAVSRKIVTVFCNMMILN